MGQNCSICFTEEPQRAPAFVETSSSDSNVSNHSQVPTSYFHGQAHVESSPTLNFSSLSHSPSTHKNVLSEPGNTQEDLDQIEDNDRLRRLTTYRLEQAELARREAIVTAASQGMVPIGSQGSVALVGHRALNSHHSHHRAGGVNTYYDPAYAAAAAQDILRSAAVTGGLVFCTDKASQAAWNLSVIGIMPISVSQNKGFPSKSKDTVEMLGRGRWDGVRLGSRGSGLAGCGGENPEFYIDDLSEAFLETMVPAKMTLFGGCSSVVENLP